MKIHKRMVVMLIAAVLIFGAVVLVFAEEAFLPGINSSDDHPQGCIDCHKSTDRGDYRLNVELKNMDDHPNVDSIVKTLPDDCMLCHNEEAKAGSLSLVTHKFHYEEIEDNHFVSGYQGSCLHCHTLNTQTWQMSVKSGTKNW